MTATDDTDYVKLLAEMLDTLDVSAKPIAVGYEEYGAHLSLFGPLLGVSITEKSLFPWKGSGGDGCIDILFLNTTQISQVFNQCAMRVYSGLAAADLVEKEISSVRSLISDSVSKTPIGQAEKNIGTNRTAGAHTTDTGKHVCAVSCPDRLSKCYFSYAQ